jgi:hypothetical protein
MGPSVPQHSHSVVADELLQLQMLHLQQQQQQQQSQEQQPHYIMQPSSHMNPSSFYTIPGQNPIPRLADRKLRQYIVPSAPYHVDMRRAGRLSRKSSNNTPVSTPLYYPQPPPPVVSHQRSLSSGSPSLYSHPLSTPSTPPMYPNYASQPPVPPPKPPIRSTPEQRQRLEERILNLDEKDITVNELKDMLRDLGRNANGRKQDLLDRVQEERRLIYQRRHQSVLPPELV